MPDYPKVLKDVVRVPHPGTPEVFQWPYQLYSAVTRATFREGRVYLQYGPLTLPVWRGFQRHGDPGRLHVGNAWAVFRNRAVVIPGGKQWEAVTCEWLRADTSERFECNFPIDKFPAYAILQEGDPIGFFCAGPSRHAQNSPDFQHRTQVAWFSYQPNGTLRPLGFEETGGTPPPPPDDYDQGYDDAIDDAMALLGTLK